MQTIGLVGGMSWQSSAVYYRLLNEGVEARLGGLSSAKLVLSSVEFARLTDLQRHERWDEVADILVSAARGAEAAGADMLLLCTTSFHRVAEQVEDAVGIPLLHLADVVATAVKDRGLKTVALIGTTFTMERTFFTERLASNDLRVLVPDAEHHEAVDRIIYDELVLGRVSDQSRRRAVGIVDELWDDGAEGVILGCTELETLLNQSDLDLPVFPCTTLHVEAALARALS